MWQNTLNVTFRSWEFWESTQHWPQASGSQDQGAKSFKGAQAKEVRAGAVVSLGRKEDAEAGL